MTTLGAAQFAEDSDPEDQDFEGSPSSGEAASSDSDGSRAARRRGKKRKKRKKDKEALKLAEKRAEKVWAEMQAADAALPLPGRRPIAPLADPLWKQLQQRHPPPVKRRSQAAVLDMLAKHRGGIAVTKEALAAVAVAAKTAAETKKRVRAEVAEARKVTRDVASHPSAGSGVKQRVAKATGHAENPAPPKNTVQDATVEWKAYKELNKMDGRDLARDKTHSGALERKAFLARAKARAEAANRAAARAAARQRLAAQARAEAH